jgi:uncharacterized protein (TIGR02246 family)
VNFLAGVARLVGAFALLSTLGCTALPNTKTQATMNNDLVAIRATLDALNVVCVKRDIRGFMGLFSDTDDILFIGSDKGEVYHGRKATSDFMQMLFNLPFVFSFDLNNVTLRQDGNYAWIFSDGNMIHTGDKGKATGKVSTKPYRFSITLVKHDGRWNWQLFHGSVPGAE